MAARRLIRFRRAGRAWGTAALVMAGALLSAAPAPAAAPTPEPAAVSPSRQGLPDPTAREKELLERIRDLKAPRLRSYGACRYDWGSWRLNEKGVRSTGSECGDPPIRGTVAVYCDTLQINRRVEEGPWEGWRLPYTAEESPLLGGEDRLVAALCANVRSAGSGGKDAAAPVPSAPSATPPPLQTPPPAKPLRTPSP
jgi:hypothetical protein